MPLGWALVFHKPIAFPVSSPTLSLFLFLMFMDQMWASDIAPAPCLPACFHASHHDDHGLTLWNYKPPLKSFFSICLTMMFCHGNRKVTKGWWWQAQKIWLYPGHSFHSCYNSFYGKAALKLLCFRNWSSGAVIFSDTEHHNDKRSRLMSIWL